MTTGDPARSFGAAAEKYEDSRPGYPDEAVDWLLSGTAGVVVDVGAGTGKLTTALSIRRPDVRAVEPDAAMRDVLVRQSPHVIALPGAAEKLPFDDDSAALVTFAQSWHWVDVPRACAELSRVLQRPGRVAMVWNYRDESDEWVSRLSRTLGGRDSAGTGERVRQHGPELAAPFASTDRLIVPWRHTIDVDTLVDLAASRSYVIVQPELERLRLLAAIRLLGEERADPDGGLDLPYVTYAFRADLIRPSA